MRAARRSPYALRTRRWLTATLARPAFMRTESRTLAQVAPTLPIHDSRLTHRFPLRACAILNSGARDAAPPSLGPLLSLYGVRRTVAPGRQSVR